MKTGVANGRPVTTTVERGSQVSGWVLAIDFGTSNTAAAHTGVRSGAVETLPLSHHGNLMPSAVFVESPASILVGEVALNRAQMNPAAFVAAPKRMVGQGMVRVNNVDVPDTVLVAAVFGAVLERGIGVHGGQPPEGLVLTHPEAWSPQQVQVLVDAAALVGFARSRVRTVSEPRAAAHFYARNNRMSAGERIAVFDFGGGTLDIAVLAATEQHSFEVIAARGDNRLGGKNLDAALRHWVDEQLRDHDPALLEFLRTPAALRVSRQLDESLRRAKELLSEAPSATIAVESNSGRQETLTLTRGELDFVIGHHIGRAIGLTQTVFHDARLTGPRDLRALYLTGGSSRIPLVHERLRDLGPVATLDDPKTVVVQGALHAAGGYATATTALSGRPDPQPAQTAAAVPTPAPRRNRTIWVAVGLATIVVAAVVAVLVTATGGGAQPEATSPTADGVSSHATASTSASVTTSAPARDRTADEQAIKTLTTAYIPKAGNGTAAELNPMRCAKSQRAPDSPNGTVIYTLGTFISVSVSGDTGSARFNLQQTDSAGGVSKGIMVGDYAYEGGAWKWCAGTVQ